MGERSVTAGLIAAGITLGLFLAGWFAIWTVGIQHDRAMRRLKVERWRKERAVEFPEVSLAEPYDEAIYHTLTSANLVTADALVAAIERRHRPPHVEVPSVLLPMTDEAWA